MKKFTVVLASAASALAFAATAHAAAYIKFDGVDGECKAEWSGANTVYLTTDEEPQAVGLLLPAVQKAREAARRSSSGRGQTVDEFEIEEGDKRWTLYDAKIQPTSDPHTVEVNYRCKDWMDLDTGAKGSDCRAQVFQQKAAPARTMRLRQAD